MAGTVTPDPAAPTMTWEQHHEAGRRRFAEGDAAGAEQAFRAAIAQAEQSGGDPLQRASSLSSLGQLKYQQKDYKGAEDCFRQSLELREAALGADHPTVISGINNLAALFVARGALDEAEPLLQRAMAVTVKRVEATQAELAVNLNNLVRLYVKRGDYTRAEPLVVRLLALKRPLGPEHPDVAAVLVTLAKLRQSMGQSDGAERLWRRVLAVRQRTLAPNDQLLASTLDGLADSCAAQGKTGEELSLRERSLAVRTAAQGPDNPALEPHKARIAALRQAMTTRRGATPASSAPAAGAPPAPTKGTDAGIASGKTGLTGVIPNVIPEAMALTRAMNEKTAKAAEQRPEPTTGALTAAMKGTPAGGVPRGSRPPGATVAPADKPRPTPIPVLRRPTPIPELETQSAADSAAASAAPESNGASTSTPAREPRTVPPVAGPEVKWVEPANVVPPPPRVRPSSEFTRPKLKMGGQSRVSGASTNGGRSPLWYAAAVALLACGVAAALYARHRLAGETVSTSSGPAHPLPHHAPPGVTRASPAASLTTTPTNQPPEAGSGVAGVTATSGPSAGEPEPVSTTAERTQGPNEPGPAAPAPAASSPVRMSPLPPAVAKPAAAHHAPPRQSPDAPVSLPNINLDDATRAIDSSVKARHSP